MHSPLGNQTDRLNPALAGRYRIIRLLGEGGMATVYLCDDLKHDRKVALKLLKPELAAVLGAERFVQEIKTTAALGVGTKVTRTPLLDARKYLKGSQSSRNFDVSRDGKSFIFLKRLAGSQAGEPVIVLNWMEEVKRLMAVAGIK